MAITLQNLAPFGIEMTGINISEAEEDVIFNLKHLLAHHGVVIIRQQWMDDAEFVSFLKRLGSLMFTAGEKPVPHQPCLNLVSNVGRDRPPRSVFHTDTSYVAQPPAYTALKAISLPEFGGETLFCNQYCAFETLSTQVKQRLSSATVLHVASGVKLDNDQESQAWHSLFKRHPISGKTALFLSTPERCQVIQGFNLEESQRAIRSLYKHSIRSYRLYRHYWQNGDIVIWDNRCTMHRADHSEVIGDRVLYRGLIASEMDN
ncbi:MAG: TauD/TfdA family dioxygenase [Nostoc sp.]|uniref:TauD/TfdA dioxygenase family protein n=1 Tax=Nostoc sp. TaxID=1180 RepID=UPI002FF493F3